jgi:hypothetical protein
MSDSRWWSKLIKVKQVKSTPAGGCLVVDYDVPGEPGPRTVEVDLLELRERLRGLKRLTGEDPDEAMVKRVLRTLIGELRVGSKPTIPAYDYTRLINIDLEAEEVPR